MTDGLNPIKVLLLISDMEGAYQNAKKVGLWDDAQILRDMCDRYYKLYFKLKREQKSLLK